MESKLRKPDYTYMHVILNQCIRGRMAQAMFAVFLHSTLRILICLCGVSITTVSFSARGGPSPLSAIFALLLLLLASLSGELLSYGLYSILAPLVRNRASSIRGIFSGFRERSGRVRRTAWAFTAINTAAILAAGILAALLTGPSQAAASGPQQGQAMLAAAGAFIALIVILTLPFTFCYLIILTKPDVKAGEAFAVSWRLLYRQPFHFIGFVIYAGGTDLAAAVFLQLVLLVLPSGEGAGMGTQLLSTLASFMGLLAQYRAMSRAYLAICIYFFCEAGILRPHGGTEEAGSLREAPGEVPSQAAPEGTAQDDGEEDP